LICQLIEHFSKHQSSLYYYRFGLRCWRWFFSYSQFQCVSILSRKFNPLTQYVVVKINSLWRQIDFRCGKSNCLLICVCECVNCRGTKNIKMQCCNQISLYWLLAFFASVCCGNKCEISCQNFGRLLAQFVPLGNLTARSVAHLVPVMQCRAGALGASQFQPTNYLKTRKTNLFQQQLITLI